MKNYFSFQLFFFGIFWLLISPPSHSSPTSSTKVMAFVDSIGLSTATLVITNGKDFFSWHYPLKFLPKNLKENQWIEIQTYPVVTPPSNNEALRQRLSHDEGKDFKL